MFHPYLLKRELLKTKSTATKLLKREKDNVSPVVMKVYQWNGVRFAFEWSASCCMCLQHSFKTYVLLLARP